MNSRLAVFLFLLVFGTLHGYAQFVYGVVTDNVSGDPLPGVHVYYADDKGSLVQTDSIGRYKIVFRRGALIFSMAGFELKSFQMKKSQRLNVKLKESTKTLREVEIK
ncbi:MAG: carboxypeptidase-like regulatory domain-containing protein, partial [Bacteroidaceae bacterium]|nr:carboxypeptidase-like regulatory domain-containing protein [Bacteroidaceae bacterium]